MKASCVGCNSPKMFAISAPWLQELVYAKQQFLNFGRHQKENVLNRLPDVRQCSALGVAYCICCLSVVCRSLPQADQAWLQACCGLPSGPTQLALLA